MRTTSRGSVQRLGATGGGDPASARRRRAVQSFQRVVHEHPRRAVVEVQQPRQSARSSSRWTLSTSAAPRARAARATCPGPPERSSTVRPSRSISSSAGDAGASSRPARSTPDPLRLLQHEPLDVRADRGHLARCAGPPPLEPLRLPERDRPDRGARAVREHRLQAQLASTVQRAGRAPCVRNPQWAAPGRSGMRAGDVRRRLAHRRDAHEPAPGPDLDRERARRAPQRPSAHDERRRARRPPAAGCEMPAVTSAARVRLDANLLEAQARSRDQRTCAPARESRVAYSSSPRVATYTAISAARRRHGGAGLDEPAVALAQVRSSPASRPHIQLPCRTSSLPYSPLVPVPHPICHPALQRPQLDEARARPAG